MSTHSDLTAEYVRSILHYDPDSGIFTWKHRSDQGETWNTRYAGQRAGGCESGEYRKISINKNTYKAHRLAWLFATGNWPVNMLDHKDCDRDNNRICNLRPATNSENTRNAQIYSNNTSGIKGVTWRKNRSRWVSRITVDHKVIFLGMFRSKNDAERAVLEAREKLHGDFARQA